MTHIPYEIRTRSSGYQATVFHGLEPVRSRVFHRYSEARAWALALITSLKGG